MSEENQTPSAASTLTSAPQTQTSEIAQGQHPLKMPESYDSIQGYTPEQQQQMARWEVEDGRLSLEEANEMLLKTMALNQSSNTKKLRIQSLQLLIKTFLQLNQMSSRSQILAMQVWLEIKEASTAIRDWMSNARFTKEIGNFVIRETKVSRDYGQMSPEQRQAWSQPIKKSILKKMWGSEYKQKLAFANKLVKELDQRTTWPH
jgi:hypothetical protein